MFIVSSLMGLGVCSRWMLPLFGACRNLVRVIDSHYTY
jgi:hypothetical protein